MLIGSTVSLEKHASLIFFESLQYNNVVQDGEGNYWLAESMDHIKRLMRVHGGAGIWYDYRDFFPIRLNQSLLERLNLEEVLPEEPERLSDHQPGWWKLWRLKNEHAFELGVISENKGGDVPENSVFLTFHYKLRHLKYLHELQNLIALLTNTEPKLLPLKEGDLY